MRCVLDERMGGAEDAARRAGEARPKPMPQLTVARKKDAAATAASAALISKVAQRDPESFAALFVEFAPRVKRYMMMMNASPALAEELTQEALLTVWRKADRFDPAQGTVEGWIFTIARNLRIDAARRRTMPQWRDDTDEREAEEPSPEAALLSQERFALVSRTLLQLSSAQQQVLRATLLSDRPLGQVADELGLPLSTTKSHLRRGLARLRELIGASD